MKRLLSVISGLVLLTLSLPCFGETNKAVLPPKYQNAFYIQVSSKDSLNKPYSFLKAFVDIKGDSPIGIFRVIGFYPSDESKDTIVKYEEFEINNISKTGNAIQFDVLLSGSWDSKLRSMKVIITNINDDSPYNDTLEGKSVFYSEASKSIDEIRWASKMDRFFTLKYSKVL